jgi:glutamyl/glutaminyl-tRNA synthetase
MVLLRSDGTPTYMLAVVVDDHDMGVTHVIRGDDHLNNAARQMMIYAPWAGPAGLGAYPADPRARRQEAVEAPRRDWGHGIRAMGYPAAGMRNYLARLGWSHGDDEFFTDERGAGVVRPRRDRQVPGAVRHEETGQASRPGISRGWKMLRSAAEVERYHALTGAPTPFAGAERRTAGCDVLPQGSRAHASRTP